MSEVTRRIAKQVHIESINLMDMSRETGISYKKLYASIGEAGRGRDLRDEEFLKVCRYLKMNPVVFAEEEGRKE